MRLLSIGIRWRLVALIVLMIVPVAVLIFVNARTERARMVAAAEEEILGQARLVASAHNQLLHTAEELLGQLSTDPALIAYREPACQEVTARITSAHLAFSNIGVADLDGLVRCSSNPAGVGTRVDDRQYFQQALATRGLSTSGYLFGRISQRPVDVFAMPVFDGDEVVGVIELSVDIAWLANLIEAQGLRTDVQTTVLGTDGLVLVRVPADEVTTGSNVGEQPWAQGILAASSTGLGLLTEPGKGEALSAVVPLEALSDDLVPGYVVVTTPRAAAFALAESAFRRGMLTVAGVALVGLAWAWSISTISVHRPVRALLGAAREYATGAFEARVGLSRLSSGEMTELAGAFESMADAVAESQETLRRNATTDQLTGLPNRAEFTRLMDLRLDGDPPPQALLVFQLHGFGAVNATFGFDGGDVLLQQVGPRLASAFGEDALLGRTGGDEFVVFVPLPSGGVSAVASRLEESFDRPFDLHGEPVYLSVRAGCSLYPRDGVTGVVLTRRASLAQRRAKLGTREFVAYQSAEDEPRADQVKLLSALRGAVDAGRIELFYQPKVDLQRSEVMGAEALMRWQREDGTYVPPSQFIQLAEQSGFIRTLTAWGLESAAAQVRDWYDSGHHLKVGLNVSAADFEDPLLAERLRQLRVKWELPAGALDIEITESSLMSDTAAAAQACEAIRDHGFTIAIDDFGTGYSPLVYLQQLPITSIKIDQVFVRDILTSSRSRDIVETTLTLAHRVDVGTVAEGVETEAVADLLKQMGCQVGQGFYFGRPMPAAEFTAWLQDNPLGLTPARTVA